MSSGQRERGVKGHVIIEVAVGVDLYFHPSTKENRWRSGET